MSIKEIMKMLTILKIEYRQTQKNHIQFILNTMPYSLVANNNAFILSLANCKILFTHMEVRDSVPWNGSKNIVLVNENVKRTIVAIIEL